MVVSFVLPGRNKLSKEQLDIINLPVKSSWVIEGGPGTGKTVMAFYRAAQIETASEVPLLVYNRPLRNYLHSAVKDMSIENCNVYTYFQWIESFYTDVLEKKCPYIGEYKPDWAQVNEDIENVGKCYEHIIIDEAQDFPLELIKIVGRIAKSVTCFIDPNQTINIGQTDVRSAVRFLRVPVAYRLTKNFRNTIEIRDLAALYCQGGEPPVAYVSGEKPRFIKCNDYDEQTAEIVRIIEENLDKSIGIICGTKKSQVGLYHALKDELSKSIRIQSSSETSNINFDITGVKILNYSNMKGLEFDIVILPRIEKIFSSRDKRIDMNRMYVAISRAVDELYLFYFGTSIGKSYADVLWPILENPDVVTWWE